MKTILTGAVALIALTAGAPALAQEADSKAGALLVAPLEVQNTQDLYFGTIAPSIDQADKVSVAPDGSRDCGPALTCLSADHTAAGFEVRGEEDATYTISLPKEIRITNGKGETMVISNVVGSKPSGQLLKGEDEFTVGGTLAVAARQAAGRYNGTFTVAVEYK
ncbi:MAG: DUF4402 domain-containing protein [Erythrobacter sp.]|uniref:DUF4402 domain-containing protein n=1 Tax=Erythrobacter sp. TaxID=1042 RepID=UPI0032EAA77C